MIRYYTYYNCGGYKDLYVGSDSMKVDATYFVPLLPVWRNRRAPGDSEKIAKAEAVTQVELITNTDLCGFPHECNVLFSHAGYKAIYMTLQDGTACFCIRDIDELSRDEENRRTPFNFLFIAEGQDSIKKLDSLALSYLDDSTGVEDIIRKSISYDPIVNGIKFSLNSLDELFINGINLCIRHVPGRVAYLKTYNTHVALNELSINANNVDAFYDGKNNILEGKLLSYSHEKPAAGAEEQETVPVTVIEESTDNEPAVCAEPEDDKPAIQDNTAEVNVEQQKTSVVGEPLDVAHAKEENEKEADVLEILKRLSITSKDVDALKERIYALLKVIDKNFSHIEDLLNEIKNDCESESKHLNIISGKLLTKPSFKQTTKYLTALIVGLILGILLF